MVERHLEAAAEDLHREWAHSGCACPQSCFQDLGPEKTHGKETEQKHHDLAIEKVPSLDDVSVSEGFAGYQT